MKRFIVLLPLAFLTLCTSAQAIVAAEYFINTDPGPGNGIPVAVPSGDTSVFTASISTAALPAGFHTIAVRTRNAAGQWGLFESRGIYISTASGNAADISAAEYFIDADPGLGSGTAITPVGTGSTISFTALVPAALLTQGFHTIAIRTKDAAGVWSLFESRGFYISAASGNAADISAAEYFVDADPGPGNAIAITPISGGTAVNFAASVPAASLTPGFHFLGIRTRDVSGNWGLFESRGFYISTAAGNAVDIVAAEYFIDSDPGVGNGTAVVPVSAGPSVSFTAGIPTALLAPGFHFLVIRTKAADGSWGLHESRGFYISTQGSNMPDMVAAEYFIDADPGVGNAIPVTITPGQLFSQALLLPVPAGTAQGSHFIAIRFRGADGTWGLFDFDTLTVSGTIPVTGLAFTARREQQHCILTWHTLTEINSSHFEPERSRNGVNFEKMTTVAAAGNSSTRSDYAYTDVQPYTGLNYYRIKQVDRDGRYTWSAVQLVRMDDARPFLVFPTVTNDAVTVSGITGKVQLRLYNAARQLVHTATASSSYFNLSMAHLPPGNYWLLAEKDGKILFHQTLIRL